MSQSPTLLLLLLLIAGCQKSEHISLAPAQSPFEVFPKKFQQNILVEHTAAEWTNVSVQAAAQLTQYQLAYPSRIHTVALHKDDWLATPYTDYFIQNHGGSTHTPAAAFNRQPGILTANGENGLSLLSPANWLQAIQQQPLHSPIAIALQSQITGKHQAALTVYIAARDTFDSSLRLIIYIIKNKVNSLFQIGATSQYTHLNVLDSVHPSADGDTIQINDAIIQNKIYQKHYPQLILPTQDLSNLSIVAAVYRQHPFDFRQHRVLNSQKVQLGANKYWD